MFRGFRAQALRMIPWYLALVFRYGIGRALRAHGEWRPSGLFMPPNCAMQWKLYPLTRLAAPSLAIA